MRTLLTRVLLWGVLLMCGTASAEPDRFGLGGATGAVNDVTFTTTGSPHLINNHKALSANANKGDTVLSFTGTFTGLANNGYLMIIQSTGLSPVPARGTTTPVDLFGGGTPTVGQWELAEIRSFNANSVTLTRPLANSYKAAGAQMLTVPRYRNVIIQSGATVSAAPWSDSPDGKSGGVLAFLASGTLTNNGTIQASGLGLRGGVYMPDAVGSACSDSGVGKLGLSGEDIVPAQANSVDNSANGGGGGSCNTGGGGGGGNGGPGGVGGRGRLSGNDIPGGTGGVARSGSSMSWLTFGGGGGSGHTRGTATDGAGGRGGGIIFIRAASLAGSGEILSNGAPGVPTGATLVGHGGGAGGTLHLRFTGSGTCGANKVMAGGGKGADSDTNSGPGGGGGGGRVFFQAQGLATCAPVAPAALGGMQPTVHNGAQPTATSLVDYAGTVTVLDSGFVDVIALPTFASPPGLDSWTNNPLLKGKTQHGFSEVLFYTVGGASAPFTYTPLNTRTASDSLKEFVYPYAPASSNNAPFRLVAQAGYMGAYSDLTPELRFSFDNVPPSTTLTPDTVPLVSRFTSAKFDMTSSEPNGTFQCALDNLGVVGDGAFELCTPSTTFNSLATGDYRVTAYAVDRAGNQDPYPKSYTWRVDLTQPNTAITAGPVASPPGNPTNSKVAHFTFTGGTTYQCSLDGVPAVACGPSQTYTALAEGSHTLSVTAYSESGVADPSPATRTWVVDTVAPDTSFFNPPESPNNATTVTIEYRSPDATATFQCSLNGIDFTSMPCNGTGSGSRTFSGLVSGTRQFHVRAVDPAGNIDSSPISHTWVVDIDPPASIVITAPSAGLVNTSRPTIVGTTEPGVRVAVTVTPSDPGPPQTLNAVAGPSGAWSVIPAVLSDGSYTLSAVATDAAENTRQSAPVSITVDTLPPSRPVLAASIQGRYFTTMPISLSGMLESTAGLTPNTRVTVYVDDSVVLGPTPVDAQGGWSVSFTLSPLQDGFHWVRAMTTDAAGNVSPFSATLTFHVDLSDPTVPTIDSPGPYLTTRYPTLSGTAEVGTSLQIYFGPTPDPVTVSVSPNGRWSYLRTTPLNEGPNTVFVRSTDAAARVTDSAPVSFIVDVTKPETTIIEAPPPRDGNTTVLFRLGRPEALTYECRHIYETEDEAPGQPEDDEQAFTPCELPPPGPGVDASYIQKSNLIDGTQTLLIRAVDQAGNRDDSPASHTWSISTGPVDTDILSGPDGVGGPISSKTAVFRLWSNKGLIPFECKLDTASTFTPCPRNPEEPPDTARYEGLAEGNHTLSVRAVFALEPDTTPKSRSWTVDTVKPQPPVVTGPRSDRPTNLRKPTIQGQTLEPGLVTISIDDVQVGTVEIEGVTWLFTPTVELSSGPHVIKATVSDRAGNVSDSSPPYTIQVDADAPEVTILTGPTGPTGWLTTASFTFTFNASELVERYECALDGAAEFEACVSPYSGSVSGSNENHTMLIRAKDIAGNFSEVKSWDWKVDTTTPNTTIEFGEMKTLTNSPEATFRFSSNESSVTYTCSFNGSPFESCNASGYSRTGLGSADEESMEYTLQVKAKDPAGNEDPTPDKFTWQVDLKAPVPPVLSVPRANDILSVRTPTFQGDAEAESTVSIQENGVEIGTVQADASGDWRFVPRTELDYGSHTVTLVAKDKAGNASMPSSLVNFVLDPSLEIDARGGGLSCASAGGGGGVSLVLLALGGLALRLGRRRRVS